MTLLDLCEPLFQYVCRLSRAARKGANPDMAQVRSDIKGLFADMTVRARANPTLEEAYGRIEVVLMFFVDFMIRESRLGFARQWKELAHEVNRPGGDEEFFDELDRTLAEKDSESARQRLSVFYTCMGLGFTGWYTGNTQHLRQKMDEIASRIRHMMDADKASRVCPEAYDHVNTTDLVEPPTRKLVGVGLLIAGLAIAVFVVNFLTYRSSRDTVQSSVERVRSTLAPPVSAAAPATEGGAR